MGAREISEAVVEAASPLAVSRVRLRRFFDTLLGTSDKSAACLKPEVPVRAFGSDGFSL